MRNALLALTLAAGVFCAAPAHADIAPSPVTLHIVGQRTSFTSTGAPNHAMFELRNVGPTAAEVFLFRAVVQDGGTNHPMQITRVQVGGRTAGRTVTVPAGSTTQITVFFEMPSTLARADRWQIDLRVTTSGFGGYDSQPATIDRAHRDSARKLTTGVPKTPA